MSPEQLEAAARLFALAIVRHPSQVKAMLLDYRSFLAGVPLEANSPWSVEEVAWLSSLFPWEGVSETIDQGLFGTAVGQNPQGELCIRVYANSRGKAYLNAQMIPKFKPREPVPILIVEGGPIGLANKFRPCPGGTSSVSALNGSSTGTLGAWLKESNSGEFIGISNNHVVADLNRLAIGHDVIQPGANKGGGPGDEVGKLQGLVDLKIDDGTLATVNYVDVAWISPSQLNMVDRCIGSPGKWPKGETDWSTRLISQPGSVVNARLWGSTSGYVGGTVTGAIATVFYKDNNGNGYLFTDQLELDISVAKGDSGSLVLEDPSDEIGGLFFAILSDSSVSYANPWEAVKRETGLNFSYA